MSKIRIKNFGPIKEGLTDSKDGFVEINKLTVFIGDQGSGKSTIAKLISTFLWLEKKLVRGDFTSSELDSKAFQSYLAYQQIDDYLKDNSEIDFIGDRFVFEYKNKKLSVKENKDSEYYRPKIMYVPSERIFCSAVNPFNVKDLPSYLASFVAEYKNAEENLNNERFQLPLGDFYFRYDKNKKNAYISDGKKTYEIPLSHASSGVQSVSPLILVSNYLLNDLSAKAKPGLEKYTVQENDDIKQTFYNVLKLGAVSAGSLVEGIVLSDPYLLAASCITALATIGIKVMSKKDSKQEATDDNLVKELNKNLVSKINSCFVNVVEEPEQNLYPSSQKSVLLKLLELMNGAKNNELILTTHSPYVLGTINNSIYAGNLTKSGKACDSVIAAKYQIPVKNVSAYKIENGKIFNIVSKEIMQIENSEIDGCSDEINSDYEKLSDIEFA